MEYVIYPAVFFVIAVLVGLGIGQRLKWARRTQTRRIR
jgi:hypothetical protein